MPLDLENLDVFDETLDIDKLMTELTEITDGSDAPASISDAAPAKKPAAAAAEEEGEETEEERAEREAEEAKAAADAEAAKRIRIPKARFDEAVGRERQRAEAAERELAEFRAAQQQAAQQEQVTPSQVKSYISDLQDQYEELLVDGEREKAKAIRLEIDKARDYLTEMTVSTTTKELTQAEKTTASYYATLDQIEAKFPALKHDGEGYDEAKASEVAELAHSFITSGHDPSQALLRAVKYVFGAAKPAAAKRTAPVAAQPAATAQTGASAAPSTTGGIDISSLTQEQYEKLDDATIKKLMGY